LILRAVCIDSMTELIFENNTNLFIHSFIKIENLKKKTL